MAANPVKQKLLSDIEQAGGWEEVFERVASGGGAPAAPRAAQSRAGRGGDPRRGAHRIAGPRRPRGRGAAWGGGGRGRRHPVVSRLSAERLPPCETRIRAPGASLRRSQ